MSVITKVLKQSLCAIIATGLLSSVSVSAIYIDIDGDGTAQSQDIKSLVRHILAETEFSASTQYESAELTGDGEVNTADLAVLKRMAITKDVNPKGESHIHLSDNGITYEGTDIEVSSNGNIVTILASGEYYIDGSLSDGQIIVNVPDEVADSETVKLFFDGISVSCSYDAPVYIVNAENTSINLMPNTLSVVSDGDSYSETEAAIFAKDDLTIKGEGELIVNASTYYGIHCNNDLKINNANITVITDAEDAVRGRTSVTVKSGNINIDAEGDGIKSTKGTLLIEDGLISIKAGNDAIQAETALDITGGNIIACGDRGLTCALGKTTISGGFILATATDNQCESLSSYNNIIALNYSDEWLKNNQIEFIDSLDNIVFAANPIKKFNYALVYSTSLENNTPYSLYTGGVHMSYGLSGDVVFKAGNGSAYDAVG